MLKEIARIYVDSVKNKKPLTQTIVHSELDTVSKILLLDFIKKSHIDLICEMRHGYTEKQLERMDKPDKPYSVAMDYVADIMHKKRSLCIDHEVYMEGQTECFPCD